MKLANVRGWINGIFGGTEEADRGGAGVREESVQPVSRITGVEKDIGAVRPGAR